MGASADLVAGVERPLGWWACSFGRADGWVRVVFFLSVAGLSWGRGVGVVRS